MSENVQPSFDSGTVEDYDQRSGYGYIAPDDAKAVGAVSLFFSSRSLENPEIKLRLGDRVRFSAALAARGLIATDVHLEDDDEVQATEAHSEETVAGKIGRVFYRHDYALIDLDDGRSAYFRVAALSGMVEPPPGTRVRCRLHETPRGPQAVEVCPEPGTTLVEETRGQSNHGTASRTLVAEASLARYSGRFDKAAGLYEQAFAQFPDVTIIFSHAAMEKNRNQKQAAMRIYEKGIQSFPQNAKLHEDAGVLAMSLRDYQKALTLLGNALRLCRQTAQGGEKGVLLALARTHNRIGTYPSLKETVRYYEDAIRAFGNSGHPPSSDLLAFNIAKVQTQHPLGNLVVQFLRRAGFEVVAAELLHQITVGADLVVKIENQELLQSYGLDDRLLVRCIFKADITQLDLEQLDTAVRDSGTKGLVDGQVSLLLLSTLSDRLERILYGRIENRSKMHPAVLPVTQIEMETREDPLIILRSIFDRWLYRRDLFALNFPVVGRRFFGREKPIAELEEAINSGTATGIFGLRKVGKTSLLMEIERRRNESGDLVVHMDLLRVPIADTRWLYWKLASLLRERAQLAGLRHLRWRLGGVYPDYLAIPHDFSVATAFDADLTQLLKATSNSEVSPRPKVVLLLDEIERLLPKSLGGSSFQGFFDFFSYFRGVCQETNDFVLIITGANASIAEVAQFDGRDNPVFNFFTEIYLQLLEPTECARLVTSLGKGMGLKFSPSANVLIYKLTGGHPFFTRQFCSFLARRHQERPLSVTESLVEAMVDHYLESSGNDYKEILERFSRDYPEELDVCLELARAGGMLPLDELVQLQKGRGANLHHLEGYQIVRVQKNRVFLTMDLLTRWLRRGGYLDESKPSSSNSHKR